ncbi:dihydrofolate reductase [Lactobacillus sp. ESL0228]|uniref:dihydrofolate reductase n=1 Tax=Lactobacillus sp. ESL0228 TaxID=2069352 RepID=UPI000EFD5603|nr:dihydrofolate reductase [Lactobacillus sp. ESL0228]RMC48882.1 dihydrofolate reductase [Lactobacillus sp. ESL0228]
MLTYIWAEDLSHQIGFNSQLPWYLPADLKHFKELTMGHSIIMGRKTFTSLPNILPKRHHVILTKNQKLVQKYQRNSQVEIVSSLTELNSWLKYHKNEKNYVIGGRSVFQALISQVDYLEKTAIKANFIANVTMPQIDYDKFALIKSVAHQPDANNTYYYDFLTYQRK